MSRALSKWTSQFGAFVITSGIPVNKDQVKGALQSALGRMQEHAGKTIGSSAQQARGLLRQAEGRLQKACGDMKAALSNSRHS